MASAWDHREMDPLDDIEPLPVAFADGSSQRLARYHFRQNEIIGGRGTERCQIGEDDVDFAGLECRQALLRAIHVRAGGDGFYHIFGQSPELALFERFDPEEFRNDPAALIHVMVEIKKLAFVIESGVQVNFQAAVGLIDFGLDPQQLRRSTIETMDGQTVISTGPYALVRHPMYLGVLAMAFGTPLRSAPGGVFFLSLHPPDPDAAHPREETMLSWRTRRLRGLCARGYEAIGEKVAVPGRFDRLSIALYLLIGWSGLLIWESVSLLPRRPYGGADGKLSVPEGYKSTEQGRSDLHLSARQSPARRHGRVYCEDCDIASPVPGDHRGLDGPRPNGGGTGMIIRFCRAVAGSDEVLAAYADHLRKTTFVEMAELPAISAHAGPQGERPENKLVVMSFWDDMAVGGPLAKGDFDDAVAKPSTQKSSNPST
ncbi:hypothetical protein JKP88DRAFT_290713 [Tribonema minus]|uniref:Uncharacterized protein n=1 Tax=Tribonema minus TaxID=303371 RepID=A0A835YVW0_9STRA|nr:hypothetical protein JKP88DRAFT_290713 [Tribonema minus]